MSLFFDIIKSANGSSIEKVQKVDSEKRYSICQECPFFKRGTKSCGTLLMKDIVEANGVEIELCGCYLPDKVKYADEHCPIGNW